MTPIGVCVNIVLSAISEFHSGYYTVKAITLLMEYGLDHIVLLVTWTCSVFRAVGQQISATETIFLQALSGKIKRAHCMQSSKNYHHENRSAKRGCRGIECSRLVVLFCGAVNVIIAVLAQLIGNT